MLECCSEHFEQKLLKKDQKSLKKRDMMLNMRTAVNQKETQIHTTQIIKKIKVVGSKKY